ncbi:g13005 [Coccomyxa viridis]|uniref:non-specific serine/threonine protein kinase n=1 Tax=Coccomyxa viridis TaxID=1274662 RepID=A0ABP1GBR6_9CHLO
MYLWRWWKAIVPRTPQGGCGSSKLAHENVLEGQVGGILLTFQPYGALKDVIPCDEPSKLIYRAGTLGWRLEQRTGSQPEDELGVFEETELNHVWTGDYLPGDMLGGRYTVVSVLGRGSTGVTYRAEGPDGTSVAVKALSLRRMTNWKQLELFEREAKTLKSLDHPGIPKYIDYLSEDTKRDRGFFLVQEATRIAQEMLRILGYLSRCRPAVTHRDVKAENIVLEGGQAGGRVYLVDFGGVQAAAAAGDGNQSGSTIIGTYGYMAPEQFCRQATPASDLYGLGGTLLFILSGAGLSQSETHRHT